jgi:hypothetical protein
MNPLDALIRDHVVPVTRGRLRQEGQTVRLTAPHGEHAVVRIPDTGGCRNPVKCAAVNGLSSR